MRWIAGGLMALEMGLLQPLSADQVLFKNGDQLTGTVVRLTDGKLTFNAAMAGSVSLSVANIHTLSTEAPVEIHLTDGSVVKRKIGAAAEGHIALEPGAVLGAQTVALTDITTINPPPPPPPPPIQWEGNLSAGLSSASGNAETNNLNVGLGLVRKAKKDRTRIDAAYLFGRQKAPSTGDTVTTQDSWYVTGKYDYFVSERAFTYASSRIERDRIADLDLRLIAGFGGGVQVKQTPDYSFSTEGGVSWLFEEYAGEAENEDQLSIQLAYHLERKLSTQGRLRHDFTLYPSISDPSDFFLSTQAEVRSTLSRSMFTNLKLVLDYDASPAPGKEKSDVKYILGVGMGL